ncbi:MAG: hypothetical protein JWO03_2848 [Bacteroidetes bacterium]|nr:hypothetical protein [Bacteroidota bacterium]
MQKTLKLTAIIGTLVLLLASCKRDSATGWDTGLLAPLATTNLTIGNLIKDSILHTNADNSLSISYQNTVYELNLADQYIHIPDTSIGQKYTVDSLRIPNSFTTFGISLGAMARNLIASGNTSQVFLGQYLVNQNGHQDSLPAISNLPLAPFNFNASNFFQTVTISRGYLEINIFNNLPVEIQNLSFQILNTNSGTVVLSDNIPSIMPGDHAYKLYSLIGKTVESNVSLKVTNFQIPGTHGNLVTIDTSNNIFITAYIGDVRASSAVAVFSAQDIISQNQELTQSVGDRKFTYIDCKEGQLDVSITSSIHQPLDLTYQLVGAYDKLGHPLTAKTHVDAAQGSQLATFTQTYDLTGFAINLTGVDGTKFNTYTQVIKAHIDSNGIQTQISNSDSIHIQYFLRNIKPNYIKGYAGRDTISYAGNSPFSLADLFGGNSSNALKFDKASISVSIENGIGVDGQVIINNLTSINNNGTSVPLVDHSATPVLGRQLYINKATDFPLTPRTTTFNINSSTSNISAFISNLPNKIGYDVQIKTNPFGNRGTYDDFAYLTSHMKVNLNVDLPLSLIANNLTLRDSFNFSLGYNQKDVANIKDGVLHVILYNKFPLQANITLVAYDSAWHQLDTLLNNAQIEAAPINSSCRATDPKKTMVNVNASAEVIDKLRFSQHAILTVVFNTKSSNATCNGQYLKIYSDYNINATITGDFNYKIKF